jgi:hypothetical protein
MLSSGSTLEERRTADRLKVLEKYTALFFGEGRPRHTGIRLANYMARFDGYSLSWTVIVVTSSSRYLVSPCRVAAASSSIRSSGTWVVSTRER